MCKCRAGKVYWFVLSWHAGKEKLFQWNILYLWKYGFCESRLVNEIWIKTILQFYFFIQLYLLDQLKHSSNRLFLHWNNVYFLFWHSGIPIQTAETFIICHNYFQACRRTTKSLPAYLSLCLHKLQSCSSSAYIWQRYRCVWQVRFQIYGSCIQGRLLMIMNEYDVAC